MAYRSPPSSIIVLWMALYQAGGGRLSTVPCVGFCIAGRGRLSLCGFILQRGKDGFLPSHVRFYIAAGRGQLSTVPRVRFYIAMGGRFYRPMCSVCISPGDSSLPSPVWFFLEFSMAFEGGEGVRSPPRLSGGSELNNLTCVVEKKIRHPHRR